MGLFRTKPVVVEAFQLHLGEAMPRWAWDLMASKKLTPKPGSDVSRWGHEGATIHTEDGDLLVDIGDWIIRRPDGALSVCKPDAFAAAHEAA